MDRRDFLQRTTAAGLLLSAASCAPTLAGLPPAPSPDDMEAYLARMDRGLRVIATMPLAGGLVPDAKAPAAPSARYAMDERLARDALASLYVLGAFHDLDDSARVHPGVQARVRATLPTMDKAVFGTTAMLEAQSPERLARVKDALKQDASSVARASQRLDTFGAQAGISVARRLDLRTNMAELATRMSAQNPGLLVGEYVNKVRRVEAQSGVKAESERNLVARMGREAFWRQQEELQKKHLAWRERLHLGPPEGMAGNAVLTSGAVILGLGAAVEAIGLICLAVGAEDAWLVMGVTIGPILLTVGLIVLIVGVAIGDDGDDDK